MIDPRFVVSLKGRDYPTWPGVLDAATKAGLKSLTTQVLEVPSADNGGMAVVMARAEFEDGRVFEDVGDASPANCSPQIAAAALRMASTRAKGRCLRDALNIGQTMVEELPDEERIEAPRPAYRNGNGNGAAAGTSCEGCGRALTPARATLAARKLGTAVCLDCEKQISHSH